MIKFVIIGAIIYLFYRSARSWWTESSSKRKPVAGKSRGGEIADVMVKDPFCDVYFPKGSGVSLKVGGRELYFCSTSCRDGYVEAGMDKDGA